MSCFKKIKWEIIPLSMPKVKRNCSKCGNNAWYINTGKFRVNANKRNIDIWLIYQCAKCKSTWNMTIYERISPDDINEKKYNQFLKNDVKLATEYGFNRELHVKNKSHLDCEHIDYKILGEDINIDQIDSMNKDKWLIDIICRFPLGLRIDKVLSKKLCLSRGKIKKLCKASVITGERGKDITKERINHNLCIYIHHIITDI